LTSFVTLVYFLKEAGIFLWRLAAKEASGKKNIATFFWCS
jgi:hypothetical protein